MAISDGQKVNAVNSNAAWMSRTIDTTTAGKVDLQNIDTPSGSTVTNVQAEINGQNKFVGRTDNSGKDSLPTWTNNNYGTATDDVKTRTDVLDNATKTNENRIDGHDTDIADLQTLSGVAANSTDQGTFTGTTIPDASTTHDSLQSLETAVELRELSANKSQPNGYASLDGTGKVPVSELPDTVLGAVQYQGTWNATTNVPDLPASSPEQGDYYVVAVAGTTSLGGITDWEIGDWAIYNGTVWEKVDNTDQVLSVNSKTGVVVLDTDDVSEGATNKYYSDTLVDGRIALAELGDLSDVNMGTPPNDGEVLIWDNGSSKWIPGVAATAGVSTPKMLGGGTFSWVTTSFDITAPTAPLTNSNLNTTAGSQIYGQQFTTVGAVNITGVTFKNIWQNGPAVSNAVLKIWSNSGGQPNVVIATSIAVDCSTLPVVDSGTQLFSFASPVALSAGTIYYAMVELSAWTSGTVSLSYNSSHDPYPSGGYVESLNGGASWTVFNWDFGITLEYPSGALSFDADIELEVPGLNYSDNTIPTSESPITLLNDQDVAYVVLNTSSPGSALSVTVDTLDNVPDSGAVVIARRDGGDAIVGTSSIRLEAGQASTLYPPSVGGGGVVVAGPNLSGTYASDILVIGNATVTGTLVVQGNLTIQGDFINNGGFQVDVWGNCRVTGGCNFNPASATALNPITIFGNFTIEGEISSILPPASFIFESVFELFPGTFQVDTLVDMSSLGIVDGVTQILVTSGPETGNYFTITYYPGSGSVIEIAFPGPDFSIMGESFDIGGSVDAYSFSMQTQTTPTTLSVGQNFNSGLVRLGSFVDLGLDGSNLVVGGDFFGKDLTLPCEINTGASGLANGGNAGNITVFGTLRSSHVYANGNDNDTIAGPAGNAGNLTVGEFRSDHDLTSSQKVFLRIIELKGGSANGSATISAGSSGSILARGTVSCAYIEINGGHSTTSATPTNGGEIKISGDLLVYNSINATGGSLSSSTITNSGGNAGDIRVDGDINCYAGGISAIGGNGRGLSKSGGKGSSIFCNGNIHVNGSINVYGGNGMTDTSTLYTAAVGIAGGLTIYGDVVSGSINAAAGSMFNSGGTNTVFAPAGGIVLIYGTLTIKSSGFLNVTGGNSLRTTAGNGGTVTLYSKVNMNDATIINNGGQALVSGTAGNPGTVFLIGGGAISGITMIDGIGTAPTGNSALNLSSHCIINTLNATNRVGVKIKGYGSGTVLTIGTMTQSNSLWSHVSTNQTAAVSPAEGKIYTYDRNFTRWSVFTGVLA